MKQAGAIFLLGGAEALPVLLEKWADVGLKNNVAAVEGGDLLVTALTAQIGKIAKAGADDVHVFFACPADHSFGLQGGDLFRREAVIQHDHINVRKIDILL